MLDLHGIFNAKTCALEVSCVVSFFLAKCTFKMDISRYANHFAITRNLSKSRSIVSYRDLNPSRH